MLLCAKFGSAELAARGGEQVGERAGAVLAVPGGGAALALAAAGGSPSSAYRISLRARQRKPTGTVRSPARSTRSRAWPTPSWPSACWKATAIAHRTNRRARAAAAIRGGLWVLGLHNPPHRRRGGLFGGLSVPAPPGWGTRRPVRLPDRRNRIPYPAQAAPDQPQGPSPRSTPRLRGWADTGGHGCSTERSAAPAPAPAPGRGRYQVLSHGPPTTGPRELCRPFVCAGRSRAG